MTAVLLATALVSGCTVAAAAGVALWLRPWRCLGPHGPPWPWIVVWAVLPLLWALDRQSGVPVVLPMSGAALLVLLAGWPLAVIALLPVAAITVLAGPVGLAGWIDGLLRLMWLGVVPATFVLAIGWMLRRWLPGHLFVYILGRGYFGTLAACALAGLASLALQPAPPGVLVNDLIVARVLLALGEASLTGAVVAALAAWRPQWLATYSDLLYLTPPPPCKAPPTHAHRRPASR